MKCAVLGGGGFIGSHLGEALLASGHEVKVLDRIESRFLAEMERAGAKICPGDFLNGEDVSSALSDCDVLYHLSSATVPQTSNDNPLYDVEINVLGTLRLLEAVKNSTVKKVVFASTGGAVYGIPQELPIKESHPTDPTSAYGISKLTIEKYLHLYSVLHGLNYCILRIANAYGERQPVLGSQGVIGAFIDSAIRDAEIQVWGNGSVMRDYTYVGDIVNAFIKAGEYEGENRVFNIGAGRGYSLNEIIEIIEQVIGKPLKVRYLPGRVFDIPVNVLDISRARTRLNWQPKVGILEGISRAYEWMVQNRQK
jgi:UDP-glucose 4-epimerase